MNIQKIIADFKEAALSGGVELPLEIIADGKSRRFTIDGKPNGFYKLHMDGKPNGCFQDWKIHDKPILWTFEGDFKPFTADERRAYAESKAAKDKSRATEIATNHFNAAKKAAQIWQLSTPASVEHPYIAKKGIQVHKARTYNGALVLPLYDADLLLTSLQFIDADGIKRFLRGGKKSACYWWIGIPTEKILIAEGFATACTLNETTGYQCIIAFDAGNLTPVAEIIRAKKPQAEIVICADFDESGKGLAEANKAAIAVGGLVAMPPVIGDFNDYAQQAKGARHA